jgi:glycosyltransferase involved in cell wall biosynthesis
MKVLTISDSPTLFSGLARVHRTVIEGFAEAGHDVIPCGWYAYSSETIEKLKNGEPAPPTMIGAGGKEIEVYCVPKGAAMNAMYAIYDVIAMHKPDVVITIGDYWDFWYMRAIKSKVSYSFKWIAYLTIEHPEISGKWTELFRVVDAMVVPTQFGKTAMESSGVHDGPIEVVPYGVAPVFHRFDAHARHAARVRRGCEQKVRFITVAQNTWRKNLPALMQAVSVVAHRDRKATMQFYIHTNMDPQEKQEVSLYDLRLIASKLGVSDWFVFPENLSLFEALSDEALSEEYNSADFFVLPSTCEGFALPVVEGMACGLPVIGNASSCVAEHIGMQTGVKHGLGERGYGVGTRMEVWPPATLLSIVRPDALGQAIWEMTMAAQTKSSFLQEMRQRCSEYAKGMSWSDTKTNLCKVAESVFGPVRIPIEVL